MVFILESKKLIVLGNGFDLACDLKSQYYDFFSNRFNEDLISCLDYAITDFVENMYYENVWFDTLFEVREKSEIINRLAKRKISYESGTEHDIYEIIGKSRLTFWDFVFYFSQFRIRGKKTLIKSKDFVDYDWRDVENRMLEFFQPPEVSEYGPSFTKLRNLGTSLCLHLAYYLSREEINYSKGEWVDYLYSELRIFESDFSNYIDSISRSDDYKYKALQNIVKISGKACDKIKDKIFSFNYTDPFSSYGLDVINVHGKATTNSILFGVDQESITPDSRAYRFTKTFRQMTETKLAKNYSDKILPDQGEVEEIAFFGHSLSEFDYSYFQTIFDHYDIYNSTVRLVFYYKTYGDKTNEELEYDLASKISRMLFNYSPSIDNEKKGRNLTHKLLLEKRLIIEEITEIEYR